MIRANRQLWLKLFLLGYLVCAPLSAADLAATTEWGRRAELGAVVSGVISEIAVVSGQAVRRGDLLLRLDPRGFQARLEEADAAVQEARQDRDEAQRELERAMELYDRTLLSDRDLQLAEIGAAGAQVSFRRALAAQVQAGLELEYSQIRAPFDGVVVALLAEVGEVVASRLQVRPLVVVADNRSMRARTRITAAQAARWPPGRTLEVGIAGKWIPARVQYAGLEAVEKTPRGSLYDFYVILDPPLAAELELRAGQSVTIRLND